MLCLICETEQPIDKRDENKNKEMLEENSKEWSYPPKKEEKEDKYYDKSSHSKYQADNFKSYKSNENDNN
jgi:hypothetical protein